MQPFDPQKMEKLPSKYRFFDINGLWYFPNSWMVRWLYNKPVSANQITFLSLVLGIISIGFYLSHHPLATTFGSVFLYGKLFFDNVDGPLARARGETSRLGRFLDSFCDFVVTFAVYLALSYYLSQKTGQPEWWAIGLIALFSCFIHCSFFVFYLVQYTTQVGSYENNRTREKLTKVDLIALEKGELTLSTFFFQRCHEFVYDWQDAIIECLDSFCKRWAFVGNLKEWYSDKTFLTLASPLCLCTNTMALIVFSLLDKLEFYFILVSIGGNMYMVGILIWKVFRFKRPET